MKGDRGKVGVAGAHDAKRPRGEVKRALSERPAGATPFDPAPDWLDALRDSLSQMGPVQGVRMRPGPC